MKLFHTTTPTRAKRILSDGFKDGSGTYGLGSNIKGVFFADSPSNESDFPMKDEVALKVFVIDFPEKILKKYQIINWLGDRLKIMAKEWCIPAEVVNKYFIEKKFYSIDDPSLYI